MVTTFSTADIDPLDRLEAWRAAVQQQFIAVRVDPLRAAHFEGEITSRTLAELELVRVAAHPLAAARTRRQTKHSSIDDYLLAIHARGLAVAQQAGRSVVLRPGDCALFDSSAPYRIGFNGRDRFEHVIVRIPRLLLDARCSSIQDALAVAIAADTPSGRVLNPLFRELWTTTNSERFVGPTLDLLADALVDAAGMRGTPTAPLLLLPRLKAYTATHCADPHLSPRRVAQANAISLRHLHRLFATEGTTFGAFLRETRLHRAHRQLLSAAAARAPISEIARQAGFRSAAQFSRAFGAWYGRAPSEVRATGQERCVESAEAGRP